MKGMKQSPQLFLQQASHSGHEAFPKTWNIHLTTTSSHNISFH
jgi:hypothetical protein